MAHELDGLSFKQLAEQTGTPVDTLPSRKRNHMRRRTRMAELREPMSEDERASFREAMRRGCGHRRAEATPEA